MTSRKERPKFRFVRRGNSFRPAMQYDCGAFDGIAHNEEVTVDITQGRSNPRLRAYWGMLRECVDATGCTFDVYPLHELVKLKTGHVIRFKLKDGTEVEVPGSIDFHSMTEPEFIRFFRAAEEWLAREFGFVRERIEG